ncbi:MAG: tripartite tricarboxylate transporter substrate binding protein [Burkholderiales bacterium]|nr:tripartite tricarboxylate transporter substrate binding protein [Burkholderiales bacterium]
MHPLTCSLAGAALALALMPIASAQSQGWPAKSIRMVVNFAAGGSTDVIARSMAQKLATTLGQPVVVDNRVGAAGNIGLDVVARAAPDGYTLLHSSDGPILINPHIFKMETDVAKDLLPIAPTAGAALFVVARPGIPARTMAEFLAYARANPGKLNYGSAGSGTLQHVAIEMMMEAARFNAVHVPYKGSQAVLVDLLGGQVDFTVDLGAAIPYLRSGKLRLLAVPTRTRSPLFPDAPTLIESGVDVDLVWISGVYAPAGTPQPVVARLNQEIARIMRSPEAKAQLDAMAAQALPAMTPEQFAAHQQRARDRFGGVVRRAGIKAN